MRGQKIKYIDLHSTMFIFIFTPNTVPKTVSPIFTFHYVYIYMAGDKVSYMNYQIYIPLCLYLYDDSNILSALTYLFTFHYVYIYMSF